eukprot:363920-Chlamydomonas_euryale.AAC.5
MSSGGSGRHCTQSGQRSGAARRARERHSNREVASGAPLRTRPCASRGQTLEKRWKVCPRHFLHAAAARDYQTAAAAPSANCRVPPRAPPQHPPAQPAAPAPHQRRFGARCALETLSWQAANG